MIMTLPGGKYTLLKKMNISRLLIFVSTLGLATTSAAAAINYHTNEIAPFVFPNNKPDTPPNFVYAPDGNGYLVMSDNGTTIDRYDTASGKKIETIFDIATCRETKIQNIEGFEISDNGRYILVYRNTEKIYRRSFMAEYYVYEVRTRMLLPLSDTFGKQRAPIISPDGRMIAFVAPDNNIYIKKLDYNSQVAVTKDGELNKVINGVPDWVYEEEFATDCSMTWSPDNLILCFLKYDESDVKSYSLPLYQGTCNPMDEYALYPGTYTYKYPVAGTSNSKVTLHSYDVETRKAKKIDLPDSRIEYIPRIEFGHSSERLMVSALNRDQNRYEIFCTNPRSTVSKSVYVDETKGWIEESYYTDIKYYDDFFIVMSGRSGYDHLYQYSYSGALTKTLTKGDFDVTKCYGYDKAGNFYYQAASPSPLDRVVYKIDQKKGTVSPVKDTSGSNSADFSKDMTSALIMHSDVNTPPQYTLITLDGKTSRVIEDNREYTSRFADLPKKEFFTMSSDGYVLNGYIIKPAQSSSGKKYPVIMSQYSGPGSQSVLNKWSVDWEQYFAMQGYVVICVDGRGTGGRGRQFEQCVYRNLGHFETIDQINAARHAASLNYVDASKIGIYGWSYGGYEALMAASADGANYAAAVAIAPVTDWRFYDTIYAERYMLTPQQNEDGYEASAPINRTDHLACPLLIMYGTSDDNVHPANSLQYVSQLQSDGGYCDMFVFPNMNHSIYGCNARAVVYAKMLDYFNTHLK